MFVCVCAHTHINYLPLKFFLCFRFLAISSLFSILVWMQLHFFPYI